MRDIETYQIGGNGAVKHQVDFDFGSQTAKVSSEANFRFDLDEFVEFRDHWGDLSKGQGISCKIPDELAAVVDDLCQQARESGLPFTNRHDFTRQAIDCYARALVEKLKAGGPQVRAMIAQEKMLGIARDMQTRRDKMAETIKGYTANVQVLLANRQMGEVRRQTKQLAGYIDQLEPYWKRTYYREFWKVDEVRQVWEKMGIERPPEPSEDEE